MIHRCLFARSSRRRRHTPRHASATLLLRQSAPRASLPYHPAHAEHGASSGRCTRPSASPTVGGRCRPGRLPIHPSTSPLIRVETCESPLGAGRAEDQPALRIAHRRSLLRSCSLTSLSIIPPSTPWLHSPLHTQGFFSLSPPGAFERSAAHVPDKHRACHSRALLPPWATAHGH